MSASIVLWAGALGVPGAEAVLVMALALGLCSAAAATLWQLAPLPRAVAPVDIEAVQADRRQSAAAFLSRLWPGWRRPREAVTGDDPAAWESLGDASFGREQVSVI